jgi:hypothetical protein
MLCARIYLILFVMQDIAVCYVDACVRVLPTAKIHVSGEALPLAGVATPALGGAPDRDIHVMAVQRCISVWNWFAPTPIAAPAHQVAFKLAVALPSAAMFASLTKNAIDNTFTWSHKQPSLTHARTMARLDACIRLIGVHRQDASVIDTAQTLRLSKVFECVCCIYVDMQMSVCAHSKDWRCRKRGTQAT